jgi:RNA polymerase sigma factor (TIGR02999 family)
MRPGESPPAQGRTLESITVLLHAWQRGDADAFARVVQAVHAQLLRMAASRLQGHDSGTLAKGEVVNEAVLRLMQSPGAYNDRAHFFATVALTMRSVLRDHARARLADRRGGDRVRVTLNSVVAGEESMAADLLTLDRLLDTLAHHDPRAAQVMELTYFVGLPRQEIAELLAISVPTVDRELRFSRAWLAEQLGRDLEA